ncbi:MAG: HD domain-containing protein [Candidatus Paceibacterota bacterium]
MDTFISPENSFKVEKAISYLIEKYNESGKNPKPVVLHSLRVGMYLLEHGYDTDTIIAGVLHDLVEDSDVTVEEIKEKFSPKVAEWIDALSFRPEIEDPTEQYQEMFRRTILAGKIPMIIKAVDILVNSFYIHLIPDLEKQKFLLQKIRYFIDIASSLTSERPINELRDRYNKERDRLTKLENIK